MTNIRQFDMSATRIQRTTPRTRIRPQIINEKPSDVFIVFTRTIPVKDNNFVFGIAIDGDGAILWGPRAEFQAWAVGELRIVKTQCYRVVVRGTARQAFLGDNQLLIGSPFQSKLSVGMLKILIQLRSAGPGQFHFKLASCVNQVRLVPASEETPLPDVVDGLADVVLHVRVHNLQSSWVRNAVVSVPQELNSHVEEIGAALPTSLAPGQELPLTLHAHLRHRMNSDLLPCPVPVNLQVSAEAGLETPLNIKRWLRCRNMSTESFLMGYLDADGSPQIAGLRAPKEPCNKLEAGSCPVLLSTHGMDVTAQRQADAYRQKSKVWVLAPHGRSAFAGLNWQNQGHRSAWAALAALEDQATQFSSGDRRADVSRVIFTGHSNGGFGALLLATEQPALALCVAPLAGMLRLHSTVFNSNGGHAELIKNSLQSILDASLVPYDLAPATSNIAGIPCLARTGAQDEVINPRSTTQLVEAVRAGGGKCEEVHVPGKGHWWWDTELTMDGGVLDDAQLSAFWDRCVGRTSPPLPLKFTISCVSLSICGGRGGLVLHQQLETFWPTEVHVVRAKNRARPWQIRTVNLRVLAWRPAPSLASEQARRNGFQIDGALLSPEDLRSAQFACRVDSGSWHPCPSQAACCAAGLRSPAQSGPLRAIFEGSLLAVVGTTGSAAVAARHLNAAVLLAHGQLAVGGGRLPIVLDTEFEVQSMHLKAASQSANDTNVLLLGGPDSNPVTSQAIHRGRALPDLWLGANGTQIHIGPCHFQGSDLAFATLGPWRKTGLFALLMAASTPALGRLLASLGGLGEKNFWQMRAPDFLLLGSTQEGSPAEVLAAGFWGGASGWEFARSRTFLKQCVREKASLRLVDCRVVHGFIYVQIYRAHFYLSAGTPN